MKLRVLAIRDCSYGAEEAGGVERRRGVLENPFYVNS